MDAHGYTLAGNSRTQEPDFIPSLVGYDPEKPGETTAIYFNRVEFDALPFITSIAFSRWVEESSGEPIFGVKHSKGAFYTPRSDLVEVFGCDPEAMAMLRLVEAGRP